MLFLVFEANSALLSCRNGLFSTFQLIVSGPFGLIFFCRIRKKPTSLLIHPTLYLFLYTTLNQLLNLPITDPPEIEIEQNWYHREGEQIEVELNCVVHARPEATVSIFSYTM